MNITQNLKHDYLTAMGIEQWYPRVILSNAKTPLQLVADAVDTVEPSPSVDSSNEVIGLIQAPAVDENVVVVEVRKELPSQSVIQNEHPTVQPQSKPIRFGLGLYILNDYLVASSLSSDHEIYQHQALQLVKNIIKSFDSRSLEINHHHVIAWPLFTNQNADQGVAAAKQYVNGVIDHLNEEYKVSKLLVFGGVLPKLNGWVVSADRASNRLILPSVYRMMNDPQLKAKAWQLIQQSSYYQNS